MWCKRQVWEKSEARVLAEDRFLKNHKILKKLKILKKMHGILIRNNAFVAWASLPGVATLTRDYTWLVETRYFSLGEQYYSTAGAN